MMVLLRKKVISILLNIVWKNELMYTKIIKYNNYGIGFYVPDRIWEAYKSRKACEYF